MALLATMCPELTVYILDEALLVMGLQVPHFPFPTPPEAGALTAAQNCLVALSALQPPSHPTTPLGLTPLGRAMSRYPITPRHARMLLQASHVFLFANMEHEYCHRCYAPCSSNLLSVQLLSLAAAVCKQ